MTQALLCADLKAKLNREITRVMIKAAEWRAMGDKFPRAAKSFDRSADAMAGACAAAMIIAEGSVDTYLLSITLRDMMEYRIDA